MAKRAKPCDVCGAKEGPSVFSGEEQCSVFCEKFMSGTITVERYEAITGNRFNTGSGIWDKKVDLQKAAE